MEQRIELLTHPNIPKPLHGLNPRTILGAAWWDHQRQIAYAARDYCCWACGIHKAQALKHQWLEAHECYDIDYAAGCATMTEIVALCHYCHNFIHSGRLVALYQQNQLTRPEALRIVERGINLCTTNGYEPFYVAYEALSVLEGKPPRASGWKPKSGHVKWGDWRLILEGKEYAPLFKDADEWRQRYGG